jgi:uncharacterized protein YndB with AHSA1/START domain
VRTRCRRGCAGNGAHDERCAGCPRATRHARQEWCSTNGSSRSHWRNGCVRRPVRVVDLTVEPRVGGNARFDVDDSGTRILITGHFLTIDRRHLLRFTWSHSDWPDPTAASIVTVAFEPLGDDQTLMTIEHSLLPRDNFGEYQSGWAGVCDQFAACLPGLRRVERE